MTDYKYVLGVDVWEGQLDVDEDEFKRGGVEYFIVRLNDINGINHKDENFDKQWEESKGFLRSPYYVFSPWPTGIENFQWLERNMPADCGIVFIDVEVSNPQWSPEKYSRELQVFIDLCKEKWKTLIYTGAWFLPIVSEWPKNVSYWLAQYPFSMYPEEKEKWSWDKIRTETEKLYWPKPNPKIGPIEMWQCTGDRIIPPGNNRPMDFNLFLGTVEQLYQWWGEVYVPPIEPPTLEERVLELEIEMVKLTQRVKMLEKKSHIHAKPQPPTLPSVRPQPF